MKKLYFSFFFFSLLSFSYCQSNRLNITPQFQQTAEWCWVTSSSMVLQYYNIPCVNPAGDYQCGLVGWYFGPTSSCFNNCFSCPVPAKSILDIRNIFTNYPQFAGQMVKGVPINLTYNLSFSPLSVSQVQNSIDNGSPVLTGISPSGFFTGISQHVTVIVGYEYDSNGNFILIVNDPFPYDLPAFAQMPNPYINAGGVDNQDGSYQIYYSQYIDKLLWHEAIYNFAIQ